MPIQRRPSEIYKPRVKAARKPRPRWMLVAQANTWRFLMSIGMFLHRFSSPRPPKPNFVKTIPTTVSKIPGTIKLHFYVPPAWYKEDKTVDGRRWPVVVNFHGGGFTLGRATDDARWCDAVVRNVDAIAVSVDYRLAPEHPFPTAVEDGVDSILYLVAHAQELGIDTDRIAVSGFSSGANMCFTVPLRLQEELSPAYAEGELRRESVTLHVRPPLLKAISQGRTITKSNAGISIKVVAAWYPPVDYTRTREQRRATAKRMDQQLPQIFTELFDDSYLVPPTMDMSNPYLSPGVAPKNLLAGLPEEIVMFVCEWDMLVDEAERFRDRLTNELGRTVNYHVIEGVAHGFDKAPNPIRLPPNIRENYAIACKELRSLLEV